MTWTHRVPALLLVLAVALLGLVGWLGSPVVPERFVAKTVVVSPAGADGLRVTEYVDLDTGTTRRRGYLRELPVTLGVPTDITASSPNAPADLDVEQIDDVVVIRVGDPEVTVRGRYRYEVAYTLPAAGVASGRLAYDVIGVEETFPTDTFTLVITGFELSDTVCSVGETGATGGCSLTRDPRGYVAVTSLEPGEGLFVGGTVTGVTDPVDLSAPPVPPQRTYPATWPGALLLTVVAGVALGAAWWWSIRRGRNEVAGTSAADAAFASGDGTRLLTDGALQRLATLEVAPPAQVTPWEAAVLMQEAVNDSTVEAWWAHAAGIGRIRLHEEDGTLVISDVPGAPRLSAFEEAALDALFPEGADRFEVGTYDPRFASAWSNVATHQVSTVNAAGWWRHSLRAHTVGRTSSAVAGWVLAAVFVAAFTTAGWMNAEQPAVTLEWLGWLPTALVVVALAAFALGWVVSTPLRASRTAVGSALALQVMSFRKFLAASEARHVEEAWKRGVLREYTAWAVALGEADTWRRAAGAAVMPSEAMTTLAASTLLLDHRADFSRSHTKPSSTKSSGGGGFGGVGSGGGGGRSGSW